ncbi:hypothetical protein NPIL_342691 [Nephila pilipes]|uniref:Uncharacterized protein n=1 Tax=Nephila pilipes TaxID=299642 RepID=A0A8X6PWW8_NEPPI|nr:hypothetical protein NPIL_342691 [Nephila pilipes]
MVIKFLYDHPLIKIEHQLFVQNSSYTPIRNPIAVACLGTERCKDRKTACLTASTYCDVRTLRGLPGDLRFKTESFSSEISDS